MIKEKAGTLPSSVCASVINVVKESAVQLIYYSEMSGYLVVTVMLDSRLAPVRGVKKIQGSCVQIFT